MPFCPVFCFVTPCFIIQLKLPTNSHAYILKTVNNQRREDALMPCAQICMLRNRKPEITLIYYLITSIFYYWQIIIIILFSILHFEWYLNIKRRQYCKHNQPNRAVFFKISFKYMCVFVHQIFFYTLISNNFAFWTMLYSQVSSTSGKYFRWPLIKLVDDT